MATSLDNLTAASKQVTELDEYLSSVNKLLKRYLVRLAVERPLDPCRELAQWAADEFQVKCSADDGKKNLKKKSSNTVLSSEDVFVPQLDSEKVIDVAVIQANALTVSTNAQQEKDSSFLVVEEAVKVLADGTKFEADTDTQEQLSASQLTRLLQLGCKPTLHLDNALGACDPSVHNYSIALNHAALNGWVKQPSPCCAGSSLAGAWNAVLGLPRPCPYPETSCLKSSLDSHDNTSSAAPLLPFNGVFPLFHKDSLLAMGDVLQGKIRTLATTLMHSLGCQRIDDIRAPQTTLEKKIHSNITFADREIFGAMVSQSVVTKCVKIAVEP